MPCVHACPPEVSAVSRGSSKPVSELLVRGKTAIEKLRRCVQDSEHQERRGKYFRARPFLTPTILVWIVAISMVVPLVLTHTKLASSQASSR
jgi:hypothetical protein